MTLDELDELNPAPKPAPQTQKWPVTGICRECQKPLEDDEIWTCKECLGKPARQRRDVPTRWKMMQSRLRMKEREDMALEGKCFHCNGNPKTMVEMDRLLAFLPGTRYFVCKVIPSHTVVILPENL